LANLLYLLSLAEEVHGKPDGNKEQRITGSIKSNQLHREGCADVCP